MEINYLREFVVLAEVGNYLAAAAQLFMSQSSLSRHIKSMEEELGIPLFDRTTRNISLSEFGKTFLPYASEITQIQSKYQKALFNYKRSSHGSLSIGSIPSMSQYKIIDLLFRFQQEYQDFTLNLIEQDSIQLIEMIENNKLELAFVRSSEDLGSQFQQILFAEDTLAAIMPRTHPLAEKDAIGLEELANETLLLLSSDTFMYHLCVDKCKKAGFEPIVGYTGRRSENIIALVEKGAGIALLTQNPIMQLTNNNISIVKISPKIHTQISLIYSKEHPLSLPAQKFVSLLDSH